MGANASIGVIVALAVSLLLVAAASVVVGARTIAPSEAISAILHPDPSVISTVIWQERFPRTLLGVVVGAALAVAGGLAQATTRNPLADPGLVGINAGGAFGVVIAVGAFGVTSITGWMWFSFLGAGIATIVVTAVASTGGRQLDPLRLVLSGVALTAVLGGVVTNLALLDPTAFDSMRTWTAGSLSSRSVEVSLAIIPAVVIGLALAALTVPGLDLLALGDDAATSLGARTARTYGLAMVSIVLLAGASTAAVGPIMFLGLIVPHIARLITGPRLGRVLALCLLIGPTPLLSADIIGRVILPTGELPAGIVSAFLGAPVLIILIRRRRAP